MSRAVRHVDGSHRASARADELLAEAIRLESCMSFMADGDYQTGTRKAMMLESYRGSRGRKS